MANYFNDFFVGMAIRMCDRIKIPVEPYRLNFECSSSMFLRPVNELEMIGQINSLKNNGAPGIDGVFAKLIKLSVDVGNADRRLIDLSFELVFFMEAINSGKCLV